MSGFTPEQRLDGIGVWLGVYRAAVRQGKVFEAQSAAAGIVIHVRALLAWLSDTGHLPPDWEGWAKS